MIRFSMSDTGNVYKIIADQNNPITLSVPIILIPSHKRTTAELFDDAIRQYVELTGISPFEWEHIEPAPEGYWPLMKPGDKLSFAFFGFDSKNEALKVQAKVRAINPLASIRNEQDERETLRRYFHQIEKGCNERPAFDAGDGRGKMYWRDHPYFQKDLSLHKLEAR